MKNNFNTKGFTLVEMLVAVSLFAVVMTVSVSALLALVDANRKAQAIQSVMNNLNVALDGMVRQLRMGSAYHCGAAIESGNFLALQTPQDCTSGGTLIGFEPFGGDTDDPGDQWAYWVSDGRMYKRFTSEVGASTVVPLTAPEVRIDSFAVYVTGAEDTLNNADDVVQPKVVLLIKGTAGAPSSYGIISGRGRIQTDFTIQATASQRVLDI